MLTMDDFRRRRIERALETSPFDVVVAISYENVYYLSSASIMTQRFIPDRLAMVVWQPGEEPALLLCTIEASLAQAHSWIQDQRGYVEFKTSPIELLADTLREKGLDRARIGFEKRALSAHYYDELLAQLPGAAFESCDLLFKQIRMVKSEQEIERLVYGAQVTDAAIRTAWTESGLGDSEKAIANRMQFHLLEGGADSLAFLVMGAGDSAAMAHPTPRPRPIEKGDIVRVDFGGYFDGYYSDLARTGIVGSNGGRAADIYMRLWEVHNEVIDAARPGVPAGSLYDKCKRAFQRTGLEFQMPHVGHGLGIGLHEHPILKPGNETALEAGMVLAIEPMHYEPDGTRFHVEDLVIVRDDGPQIVSRGDDWGALFTFS